MIDDNYEDGCEEFGLYIMLYISYKWGEEYWTKEMQLLELQ